jgi:hypothetical protein
MPGCLRVLHPPVLPSEVSSWLILGELLTGRTAVSTTRLGIIATPFVPVAAHFRVLQH